MEKYVLNAATIAKYWKYQTFLSTKFLREGIGVWKNIPTCENLALGWYKILKKILVKMQLYDTKNAPLEFIPPICAI